MPQPQQQFSTLGKPGSTDYAGLEVIDLKGSPLQLITFTSDEVTAVCPVTGQPDWYTVTIELTVTERSIESKSLKLYLQSFKDEGIFCESLASTICIDVARLVKAFKTRVTVTQKSRGGITLTASCYI